MTQFDAPTGTRADLIHAGLALFGRDGFSATSTRALAQTARTNVASIAYHFGSKEGLYQACGDEVIRRLSQVAAPMSGPTPATPEEARARLRLILTRFVDFLTGAPEAADISALMLRELTGNGALMDRIYEAMVRPVHGAMCDLVASSTGADAASDDTRLLVFSVLGQAVYFRMAQPMICRHMGWSGYGADESTAIADRLCANLDAMLGAVQ